MTMLGDVLFGFACVTVGAVFGFVVCSILASSRNPEPYTIDGVVDFLKGCQDREKALYMIVRRVSGNGAHVHLNPRKRERAVA